MRWLSVTLAILLLATVSQAASIHVRLIRASNEQSAEDERLKDIEPKLKKKLGYKFYQQLGSQKASLDTDVNRRLDLGEGFVVFIRPKSVDKNVHEVEIEWTSGRASLLKTTLKITENRSVVIKGPGVGNDWIVLALTVLE